MRTTLVLAALLAASPAVADPQVVDVPPKSAPTWRVVFYGTVVAAAAGGALFMYGASQINDANDRLCRYGAHGCTSSVPPGLGTTAQIQAANQEGDIGRMHTFVGGALGVGAGAVAAFAAYKGWFARDTVVVPTVSPQSAGATVSMSF